MAPSLEFRVDASKKFSTVIKLQVFAHIALPLPTTFAFLNDKLAGVRGEKGCNHGLITQILVSPMPNTENMDHISFQGVFRGIIRKAENIHISTVIYTPISFQ